MSKLGGLRRRISTVHPSFLISRSNGDHEAGEGPDVGGSQPRQLEQPISAPEAASRF
jgi:hypothetical protein